MPAPVVSGGSSASVPPAAPTESAAASAPPATPTLVAAAVATDQRNPETSAEAAPEPASTSFGLLQFGLLALAVALSVVSLELLVPQWRGPPPAASP